MPNCQESQLLEKCAENIQKDMHYSQILFQFDQGEKSLDKVRKIVENLGVNIVDTKIFNFAEDSVSFVLFKLDVADGREVALALSEHGYAPIKGYNASFRGNREER